MIGTAIVLSLGAAQIESFDPAAVELLIESYKELEPVERPSVGGGTPLELEAVWDSVDAHHPKLLAAEAKVQAADGDRLAAEGGFDPKLAVKAETAPEGYYDVDALEAKLAQPTPWWGAEVSAGYRIGRGEHVPSYDDRETLDRGEVKAALRIPVLADGWLDARRADLQSTELQQTATRAARDLTRLDLRMAAAEAYWKWVAAGESVVVAHRLVELAELQRAQIDLKVREGASPIIYRAENLRYLLKRRDKLVASQRKLAAAAIKLSLYRRSEAGRPERPEPKELPGAVPAVPVPRGEVPVPSLERALAKRPELEVLQAMRDTARVSGQLADNQILPKLDLELSVSKDLGSDEDASKIKSLDPLYVKAGLQLEFPLLLRKGRGKAAKSWAKVAQAEADLQLQEDQVRAQVADTWSMLVAEARRAVVAAHAANAAEMVAAGERARLIEGATSPFELNLREQAAADARLDEIEARARARIALAAWRLVTME